MYMELVYKIIRI